MTAPTVGSPRAVSFHSPRPGSGPRLQRSDPVAAFAPRPRRLTAPACHPSQAPAAGRSPSRTAGPIRTPEGAPGRMNPTRNSFSPGNRNPSKPARTPPHSCTESFEQVTPPALPAGWQRGAATVRTATSPAASPPAPVRSRSPRRVDRQSVALLGHGPAARRRRRVARVRSDGPAAGQVFARGPGPRDRAAELPRRGRRARRPNVQLLRGDQRHRPVPGTVSTGCPFTAVADASPSSPTATTATVRVQRTDTGQYLNAPGAGRPRRPTP